VSESDVLKACREYLKALGWEVTRVHSGTAKRRGHMMRLADAGTSDFICCAPSGRYVGVELKRSQRDKKHDNGQGTLAAQSEFKKRVLGLGGIVFTVASVEELRDGIRERLSGQAKEEKASGA